MRNPESRRRGEWAMARIALDKCLCVVGAEGSEIPVEWRVWRVEIELARGNWDGANSVAKCVPFCLDFFLPISVLIFLLLLRFLFLDSVRSSCSQIHQTCSRFADSFSYLAHGFRTKTRSVGTAIQSLSRACSTRRISPAHPHSCQVPTRFPPGRKCQALSPLCNMFFHKVN